MEKASGVRGCNLYFRNHCNSQTAGRINEMIDANIEVKLNGNQDEHDNTIASRFVALHIAPGNVLFRNDRFSGQLESPILIKANAYGSQSTTINPNIRMDRFVE
jgi:hypothetical protein